VIQVDNLSKIINPENTAAETAMHLTGIYPDWFKGKRYDRPVAWMAACETIGGPAF
jgi:myo-inositol catabolism protein IolC